MRPFWKDEITCFLQVFVTQTTEGESTLIVIYVVFSRRNRNPEIAYLLHMSDCFKNGLYSPALPCCVCVWNEVGQTLGVVEFAESGILEKHKLPWEPTLPSFLQGGPPY